MNKRFTYYSKDLNNCVAGAEEAEIEVNVNLTAENEDEGSFEYDEIFNAHKQEVIDYEELSPSDQEQIDKISQRLANDNAYENYMDHLIDRAESARDAAEDR